MRTPRPPVCVLCPLSFSVLAKCPFSYLWWQQQQKKCPSKPLSLHVTFLRVSHKISSLYLRPRYPGPPPTVSCDRLSAARPGAARPARGAFHPPAGTAQLSALYRVYSMYSLYCEYYVYSVY